MIEVEKVAILLDKRDNLLQRSYLEDFHYQIILTSSKWIIRLFYNHKLKITCPEECLNRYYHIGQYLGGSIKFQT